jgi:hypothetical protein
VGVDVQASKSNEVFLRKKGGILCPLTRFVYKTKEKIVALH